MNLKERIAALLDDPEACRQAEQAAEAKMQRLLDDGAEIPADRRKEYLDMLIGEEIRSAALADYCIRPYREPEPEGTLPGQISFGDLEG